MAFLLIALNETQNLVLADHSLSKNETYHCPSCQTPVHLKLGAVIRPHFAHFQNEACEGFSEGETDEHVNGKLHLKEWIESLGYKVELEAYLSELKQRPDLLIHVEDRRIALEFQCSFIPIQKTIERSNGYLEAGYEVIWVLGDQFTYWDRLTEFQKACLYQKDKQLQLIHYDVEKQKLTIRSQFSYDSVKYLTSKKQVYRTDRAESLRKFHVEFPKIGRVNIKSRHYKLIRRLTPRTKAFTELLYINQESLIRMPKELYEIVPSQWMIQSFEYEWKYRFVLWLESLDPGKVITRKVLMKRLDEMDVEYSLIPQATDIQRLAPFYEFLTVLIRTGVVKKIGYNKWSYQKPLKRYKYLEEKFKNE